MSYETYRYIFIGAAIAAALLLAISVVLFFVFAIPKVISDLTGRTARKGIDDIRKQNEATGNKVYQSSAVNQQRGKLTDKISPSGRLVAREASAFGVGRITEKIETQQLSPEDAGVGTTVLEPEYVMAHQNETTVLTQEYGETSVLQPEPGNTANLGEQGQTTVLDSPPAADMQSCVEVMFEIIYIHSDEVIA